MHQIIPWRDTDGSILYAVAYTGLPLVTYRTLTDALDTLEILEDICQ